MTHKREIQGKVVTIAGEKTVSIVVERRVMHPRYHKVVKRFKKYLVHDERNEVKVGDTLTFLNAGAYTFGSDFCDLEPMVTEVIE